MSQWISQCHVIIIICCINMRRNMLTIHFSGVCIAVKLIYKLLLLWTMNILQFLERWKLMRKYSAELQTTHHQFELFNWLEKKSFFFKFNIGNNILNIWKTKLNTNNISMMNTIQYYSGHAKWILDSELNFFSLSLQF